MIVRCVLLVSLGIGASACGSSSPRVSSTVDAKLETQVVLDGGTDRRATLLCDGGAATGTGYLVAEADARAACAAVLREENHKLLVEGPAADRVCTEIYGGPQKATVTGEIRGARVNATITRTNGCGIADWEALVPLLGKPE